MAFLPLRSKALHHSRSLSLPSGSHPAISQFDENMSRARSSESACSSLSSMNSRLNALTKLYDNIDDLLLLPHNQQIISEKCVDEYIRLLDGCSTVKDLISLTKQDLRELLSAIRRKDVNGIHGYLTSRRKSKKMIQKSLKSLRRSNDNALASLEKYSEKMTLVYMLKDAVSHQGEETFLNEFDEVDSFLQLSQENEELMNHLKEMDSSIQILEEELEFLFRQLIKTRVSLLNILNH